MKHPCIPNSLTPENLAKWITDNSVETIHHVEKTELDEETKHELEEQSSLASRAMDRLEAIKTDFMTVLKEGTDVTHDDRGDAVYVTPKDFTIPPTKGLKALKANRKHADQQLENGFKEEPIDIYIIPFPEQSQMVALDIEGFEWPEFTKDMTTDQINQHKPMLRTEKPKKNKKEDEATLPESELDF